VLRESARALGDSGDGSTKHPWARQQSASLAWQFKYWTGDSRAKNWAFGIGFLLRSAAEFYPYGRRGDRRVAQRPEFDPRAGAQTSHKPDAGAAKEELARA
jgi:hypothetical protein